MYVCVYAFVCVCVASIMGLENENFGLCLSGLPVVFQSAFKTVDRGFSHSIQPAPTQSQQNQKGLIKGSFFLTQALQSDDQCVGVYVNFPALGGNNFELICRASNRMPTCCFSLKVTVAQQGSGYIFPEMEIGVCIQSVEELKNVRTTNEFPPTQRNGGGNTMKMGGPTNGSQFQAGSGERIYGRVSKWQPNSAYGFIQTQDGRSIMVHKNNVQNKVCIPVNTDVMFSVGTHNGKSTAVNVTPP